MLGVPPATLRRHGAVSRETAAAMAAGALAARRPTLRWRSPALPVRAAAARQKPVGLVHFAAASRDGRSLARSRRYGEIGRRSVRERRSPTRSRCCRRWPKSVRLRFRINQRQSTCGLRRSAAVDDVGAAFEGGGEAAKGGVEHAAHERAERAAAELVGDEKLDVAGVIADRAELPAIVQPLNGPSRYSTRISRLARSSVTRLVNVSRINL